LIDRSVRGGITEGSTGAPGHAGTYP
jgi:hypothetical protein